MRHSKSQEGSALMFALLAIVFLTVIGLGLAMVTETEMLIGANEQVANETFIAAEAGVAVAFNNILINNDAVGQWFASEALIGEEPRQIDDRQLGYVIDYTDVYPAYQACAPWSDCKDTEEDKQFSYFFIAQARARRLAWPEDQATPDCQTEAEREEDDPQTLDYFNNIQSEKTITMGFYAAPLAPLTGLTLAEIFRNANVFGCAPIPDRDSYIQKVN